MRSAHLLVFVLAFGLANAQFSGIISGFIEGIVEGGIKGVVGAWAPLVKDGMTMMYNLMAPQLLNTITSTISGIFSMGSSTVGHFSKVGKFAMKQVAATAENGVTGGFAVFGSLNKNDQKSIAGTLGNTNRVLLSVTKLKINSLKTADKEVIAMRKVLEGEHKNAHVLFAALKSKAPKLSAFAETLYDKTKSEFNSSKAKMPKTAQQGLQMMQDSIRMSQKGIEKLLGTMASGAKKEFGPVFHLMNNAVHVTNAAF
ncbi:hypothetical protein M3Y97_01020200 [Aphelenchoides bicaudatus]|nr:hypothetical protein M3Y97_01020200 [Aphelenchoides bicaudatus]